MSVQKKKQATQKEESTVGAMIDQAAERLPKYEKQIKAVKPYAIMVANGVDAAGPYVVKAYKVGEDLWIKAQPYNPQQFFPLIFGLVLCFFGGSYLTLVAAVEAVRLTVWDQLCDAVKVMHRNYVAARDASEKDDKVDDNNDGIPDVQQISKKDLVTRKAFLIAKTVDPDRLSEALALVWGATLSVIATLRVQFAQAITLGCSIGQLLHKNFDKKVEPLLHDMLPPELVKWSPTISRYLFKSVGVTFAWFVQRIISSFHTAVRGGNLFALNAIRLAKKYGYLAEDFEEESMQAQGLAFGVALLGFYWQFSNGFGLPFPLNVLLLPVTIVEWILEYAVGL